MTAELVLVLMMSVGRQGRAPSETEHRYAAAIAELPATVEETADLVALAWHETRYAERGRDGTPPWGLLYYEQTHPEVRLTIETAAPRALRTVRWWRDRRCRSREVARWLAGYHTGQCDPARDPYPSVARTVVMLRARAARITRAVAN